MTSNGSKIAASSFRLFAGAAVCGLGLLATSPADAARGAGWGAAPSWGGGQSGVASFYSSPQKTASGERFNPNAMTAAHRTLPMGTVVRVTNRRNGRAVHVRINDRGPFIRGRVIDLSRAAAHSIGMASAGLAPVTVQVIR